MYLVFEIWLFVLQNKSFNNYIKLSYLSNPVLVPPWLIVDGEGDIPKLFVRIADAGLPFDDPRFVKPFCTA